MGVLFTNNASTTLSAAISSTSATSISVASSSTFPAPGAGEYFYATIDDTSNIEIVKVTAVSGTTWTVVRGADNTTAATFANGTTVQLRAAAALLTDIQQNIAAKSANQTVYNATTASSATSYDVGTNPQNENNAMVFLDGVMQHHDTFSFSGSTLTFDAAPSNGLKLEVIIDNLINLQSSNLTVDTFTATNGQTAFTLSDTPAAEDNLIVFIEGVFQNQDSYSISNNVLTMSAGVTTGRKVVVYVINPVNIGTPSDGTVTSAKLSGNITTPGTLTVGSHDVAFDSPTFVVDNANSRVGLGTASPSVPVDIVGDVKMSSTLDLTSHLDMPDNAKIKLGTGDDLEIYHDASHSYIKDTGTGGLRLAGNQVVLRNAADNATLLHAAESGAVNLYYDNSAKLTTASGGISVTGGITTTGALTLGDYIEKTSGNLTIDVAGDIELNADGGDINFKDGSDFIGKFKNSSNNFVVKSVYQDADLLIQGNDGGSDVTALTFDMSAAGQASFNAGITSAEAITVTNGNSTFSTASSWGAGLTIKQTNDDASPAYLSLHKDPASGHSTIADNDYIGFINMRSVDDAGNAHTYVELSGVATDVSHGAETSKFSVNTWGAGTEYANSLVVAGGKVGIGTASPDCKLELAETASDTGVQLKLNGNRSSNGNVGDIVFENASDSVAMIRANRASANDAADMLFYTQATGGSNSEKVRITSDGKLGVGTSNPSAYIQTENDISAYHGANEWVTIRGLSSGQYIEYGSGQDLSFVGVDTFPHSGATVHAVMRSGYLKTYDGYRVKKNSTTELSGSALLDVSVKFAAYEYVVTATDISNGYADVEHKVYRDNYIGQVLSMFDVSANVVYTDLGNGSDWATYARRFASGDITRVGLGNDVVAGDKIKMIVFFHGATG